MQQQRQVNKADNNISNNNTPNSLFSWLTSSTNGTPTILAVCGSSIAVAALSALFFYYRSRVVYCDAPNSGNATNVARSIFRLPNTSTSSVADAQWKFMPSVIMTPQQQGKTSATLSSPQAYVSIK